MAYRVTIEDIEKSILKEEYVKMGKKMTVCLLTLDNGHEVVGTSGCVDHKNYDFEIGKKFARQKAVDQLWPLFGYAMQVKMHKDKPVYRG